LFKLLEQVKFSQSQAMAGLDNIAAAGHEAMKKIEGIIRSLSETGLERQRADALLSSLSFIKSYLKGPHARHGQLQP
jgi:hypothetical protein